MKMDLHMHLGQTMADLSLQRDLAGNNGIYMNPCPKLTNLQATIQVNLVGAILIIVVPEA